MLVIKKVSVKIVRNSNDRLRGFAKIQLDCDIVIDDMRIIQGDKGLFVQMPNRKLNAPDASGKTTRDVVYPINQETRDIIETQVLAEYHAVRKVSATAA